VDKFIKIDGVKQEIASLVLPKSLTDYIYITFVPPVYKEIYEWLDNNLIKDFAIMFSGKRWFIKGATAILSKKDPLCIRVKFGSFLNSPQLVKCK
jgi:hypothetical protein